jgi:hypothetical protein
MLRRDRTASVSEKDAHRVGWDGRGEDVEQLDDRCCKRVWTASAAHTFSHIEELSVELLV